MSNVNNKGDDAGLSSRKGGKTIRVSGRSCSLAWGIVARGANPSVHYGRGTGVPLKYVVVQSVGRQVLNYGAYGDYSRGLRRAR
jgi:hypothetical protein